MTYEQFTEKLFAAAAAAGISPAEVYYAERDSIKIHTLQGSIDDYTVATSAGLSFRGLVNGRMGYASTEALDDEAIALLVRGVSESAALVEDDAVQEIFAGSEQYAAIETFSQALDAIPPGKHIEDALALERAGTTRHPLVQASDYNETAYIKSRVSIRNSFGLSLTHQDNMRYFFLGVVARKGDRTSSGGWVYMGRDTAPSIDAVAEEAVRRAVDMIDATSLPSGKMAAVFDKDAMGDLLSCFVDSFSAEAAQKGLSLLKDRVEDAIAAPQVTLIDDPLLPGGFSSRPFDAEGVAAYTKEVISKGTLRTLLHNNKTARIAGVASTGNASKASYAAPVRVAPSNLYLVPGTDTQQALLQKMGDGLLITELAGLHAGANAVSGDFSLSAKGYLVRGGAILHAVEQITVAGNFYTLLKDVLAIGSDLFFGMSGVGSPSVWIRELTVAGK